MRDRPSPELRRELPVERQRAFAEEIAANVGDDPTLMLNGPVPAAKKSEPAPPPPKPPASKPAAITAATCALGVIAALLRNSPSRRASCSAI